MSATSVRLIPQSWAIWVIVAALGLGAQAAADEVIVLDFPQEGQMPAAAPPAAECSPLAPPAAHPAAPDRCFTAAPKSGDAPTAKLKTQNEPEKEATDQENEEDEEQDEEEEEDEEEEDKPLETDRPDFTEASSVVGAGRIQWEMGYTFIRDDSHGIRVETHSAPEVLCRIGISENVELRVVWNYLFEREDDFGDVSRIDGAEDLRLGTKIALTEQHDWFPETAILLQLSVPTGAEAFTNRDVAVAVSLLYGWDLPCDFSIGGSTIYANPVEHATIALAPSAVSDLFDRHNLFAQSVTLGIPLVGDWWRMYIEYFGIFTEGRESDLPQNYVDGGFTWLLTNDLQLDWRAGVGLNDSADDFFTGAGIAFRY